LSLTYRILVHTLYQRSKRRDFINNSGDCQLSSLDRANSSVFGRGKSMPIDVGVSVFRVVDQDPVEIVAEKVGLSPVIQLQGFALMQSQTEC